MKQHWIYYVLSICCSWLTACHVEEDLLTIKEDSTQEDEEVLIINDSVLIRYNEDGIDEFRGIKPLMPRRTQDTANDENRGEKGRERRDNIADMTGKFDMSAQPASLKVLYSIESNYYAMKLVFCKNFMPEDIEYAFEGRTLKVCIINDNSQIAATYYIDDYHIGDVFLIPTESIESSSTIELYVGYFINNSAFWFVGEQSFDALFN